MVRIHTVCEPGYLLNNIAGSVLLFTGICLAMAGHFQSVLAASDLSAYSLSFLMDGCQTLRFQLVLSPLRSSSVQPVYLSSSCCEFIVDSFITGLIFVWLVYRSAIS